MELLTKSGTYAPYEPDCESLSHLEVYRLSEDEMREIEEQVMPTDAIANLSLISKFTACRKTRWITSKSKQCRLQ